ncbi:MAG: hypothetical protein N2112_02555 [Gemmataceae bacterium]|nr:hypothetical protein [Gemmataceae bacterium]
MNDLTGFDIPSARSSEKRSRGRPTDELRDGMETQSAQGSSVSSMGHLGQVNGAWSDAMETQSAQGSPNGSS